MRRSLFPSTKTNGTPLRVLLMAVMTLALLPTLATFAPGGQVAGFTTVAPAAADKIWYQSVGRTGSTAPCEESSATELAAGWTNWAPSWDTWANNGNGEFVCNRQITWAFDSVPTSDSGLLSSLCAIGGGAANTCVVGDTGPGGGIVFYVNEAKQTGGRYLEAAPTGWSGTAGITPDPSLAWDVNTCANLNISDANFNNVGSGSANTNAITTACTSVQAPAAWAAQNYRGGTMSNWYLPSKDELNQLCKYARGQSTTVANLSAACDNSGTLLNGFTSNAYYWTSSQTSATQASVQFFELGSQFASNKGFAYYVRPIRLF